MLFFIFDCIKNIYQMNILLVEDDLTYARIIKNFLTKNGFEVKEVHQVNDAKLHLKKNAPDIIITDYRLPDGTGIEVLRYSKETYPQIPIIFISNYSDIRVAVKAMKLGAYEYINKPIQPDELLLNVKEALAQSIKTLKNNEHNVLNEDYITGISSVSVQQEEFVNLVAPTELSVLVLGETGTGKEFIAKRIHQKSNRRDKPFIAIDCGALSSELAGSELFGHVKGSFTGAIDHKTGHFEEANGGTIFLDEVGNLSYDIQVKLLRALQERKIRKVGGSKEIALDIRVIAATNEDLQNQIHQGSFREDLYHRLNEFSILAPPLREKKEDLFVYASHYLIKSNLKLNKQVKGFDEETKETMLNYSWPGNLRELGNIIRRAVLICQGEWITKNMFPKELLLENQLENEFIIDFKTSFRNQEKEAIQKTLEDVRFNKSQAAKLLGMDRKTLYNKMSKYGLN
jgi:two-component system, NtrC family, response regulator HydG